MNSADIRVGLDACGLGPLLGRFRSCPRPYDTGDTVTSNPSLTSLPSASRAVTVIVAVPVDMPTTVSVVPSTHMVAMWWCDDTAVMIRLSPSGSLNTPDREISRGVGPTRLTSASGAATVGAPSAGAVSCGGAASTATVNRSLTRLPSASWAVTVTVAVPSATPVRVSLDPSGAAETVALPLSEDAMR